MAKSRTPKSARFAPKTERPPQGLPDRETLLKFVREAGETDKADMARAFGLKGNDRRALRVCSRTRDLRRARQAWPGASRPARAPVASWTWSSAIRTAPAGETRQGRRRPAIAAPTARRRGRRAGPGRPDASALRRLENGELGAGDQRLGKAPTILGVVPRRTSRSAWAVVAAQGEHDPGPAEAATSTTAIWFWPRSRSERYGPKRGKVLGRRPRRPAAHRLADRHPFARHPHRLQPRRRKPGEAAEAPT